MPSKGHGEKAMELGKGVEKKSYKGQLKELALCSLEKRRLRGEIIPLYNFLKGSSRQVKIGLFFQVTRQEEMDFKLCPKRFKLNIRKNFFTERLISIGTGAPGKWWNHCL